MTIQYGSFFYFFYPSLAVLLLAVLFFLLKNRTAKAKQTVIQVIAWLNLAQHLLKSVIYPHMWGGGFGLSSTAYNVCAFLILLAPFLIYCKSQALKDFAYTTGFFAGFATMMLPIWFIGKSAFSWEIYRFYICHSLLFISSTLPLLLQTHRISWKSWYKYMPLFIIMLVYILMDNILCVYMGLVPGATPETLHETLLHYNPLWAMGPKQESPLLTALIDPITPDILAHDGQYVPILWYTWPLYVPGSLIVLILFALADLKRFRADLGTLLSRFKKRS